MYIKWSEVTKLSDWYLQVAFAHAGENPAIFKGLQTGFPRCFTENQEGPVPWSVLKEEGERAARLESAMSGPTELISFEIIQGYDIPFIQYAVREREADKDFPLLPDEVRAQSHLFGELVTLKGSLFVVVETDSTDTFVGLSPAERIDLSS